MLGNVASAQNNLPTDKSVILDLTMRSVKTLAGLKTERKAGFADIVNKYLKLNSKLLNSHLYADLEKGKNPESLLPV